MTPGRDYTAARVGRIVSLVVILAGWLACADAIAAAPDTEGATGEPARKARPRICLVLSGGGARGAAHVGVIKVLEEYRVPIHCITGTSMGALVGAAYATGTSVPEMEAINKEITTELLFKENPPRQELSMRASATTMVFSSAPRWA